MESFEDLKSDLSILFSEVVSLVDSSIIDNSIQPNEEKMFKWKLDDYRYTENGPQYSGAQGEYITSEFWHNSINELGYKIQHSEPFKNILKNYDIKKETLSASVISVLSLRLNHKPIDYEYLLDIFIKDLNNEPVKCSANVDLCGLTIESEKIEIKLPESSITIRQVSANDLEMARSLITFSQSHEIKRIHSILEFNCLANEPAFVQDCVEKYIAILRLCYVASVHYTSYSLSSETIIKFISGTIGKTRMSNSSIKYYVKSVDEQKLSNHFKVLNNRMPDSFFKYDAKPGDFLSIAYQRYCESLFGMGIIERKIADAVMGLESLYLKVSEKSELTYRLRMRMAKIFNFFGLSSSMVSIINDAYNIRSQYVHGSQLNDKDKTKYSSKYENDINNLLSLVLDYLRISLICFILIGKQKDELIDIIDKSFYDSDQNMLLQVLMNTSIELYND